MKKIIFCLALACAFCAVAADDFFGPVTPARTQQIWSQKIIDTVGQKTFDVTKYGFNENLRNGQVVSNTVLVKAVIEKKTCEVVIKAGDYSFVVNKYLVANDATLGEVIGFAAASTDITAANLTAAINSYKTSGTLPSTGLKLEKVLFVSVDGVTYQFYVND